jgi:hypothetical protein
MNNQYVDDIITRLEHYVHKRGDTFSHLGVAIGVSAGYFPRTRKIRASLGAEVLARILMHYRDLSGDWLLTGQGSMLRGKVTTRDVAVYAEREAVLQTMGKNVDALVSEISELKQQYVKLNKLR